MIVNLDALRVEGSPAPILPLSRLKKEAPSYVDVVEHSLAPLLTETYEMGPTDQKIPVFEPSDQRAPFQKLFQRASSGTTRYLR